MSKKHLLAIMMATLATSVTSQTTSLKNNLFYDVTMTPNIGIEQKIDSLSTVQLCYGLHPWKLGETRRLRHWSLMPEYRYWLKELFHGHFLGIHALGGEYNIAGMGPKHIRRHHYEGWYIGAGLTYGHAWKLSEHWNLEAAIGVGFVHTAYDKYVNEHCGRHEGSGRHNYFGPTKLALNITYLFGNRQADNTCKQKLKTAEAYQ